LITNNILAEDGQPAWSSNGNAIFFITNRDGSLDIYSRNLDGTNERKILDDSGYEVDVVQSPDGRKLLMAHDNASFFNPRLFIVDFGSSNLTELSPNLSRFPAFKPRTTTR